MHTWLDGWDGFRNRCMLRVVYLEARIGINTPATVARITAGCLPLCREPFGASWKQQINVRSAVCRPGTQRCEVRMTGGRIRIRMEAYDHIALDLSAREIVDHAKRTNAKVAGPVPLPTRIERYTVLRGPFVDKKSREQFEIRTHKRIIDILEPNARTVEALNRLVVPAGVFVKIKA